MAPRKIPDFTPDQLDQIEAIKQKVLNEPSGSAPAAAPEAAAPAPRPMLPNYYQDGGPIAAQAARAPAPAPPARDPRAQLSASYWDRVDGKERLTERRGLTRHRSMPRRGPSTSWWHRPVRSPVHPPVRPTREAVSFASRPLRTVGRWATPSPTRKESDMADPRDPSDPRFKDPNTPATRSDRNAATAASINEANEKAKQYTPSTQGTPSVPNYNQGGMVKHGSSTSVSCKSKHGG